MASRGAYQNGGRSKSSGSDDEEPDEREEEEQEAIRIPTLRSTIVRVDDAEDEEDDGSPPLPPAQQQQHQSPLQPDAEEMTNRGVSAHKQQQYGNSIRNEEFRRRLESNNHHSDRAYGSSFPQRNAKGSEAGDSGGYYRTGVEGRGQRERDGDRDGSRASKDRDKNGGRVTSGVRNFDRDRPRSPRSPRRERVRGKDEGSFRRERRSRREIDRPLDEQEEEERSRDNAVNAGKYRGDEKGKARWDSSKSPIGGGGSRVQQRETGWRQRDGGGSHGQNRLLDRGHEADDHSRRDGDESPSSPDSRDPEGGSRVPSRAVDRSRRPGKREREEDRRRERERGNARDDVRGDRRREPDRGRDRERGDRRDAAVPELHSVHKATVHSVRPFGVFVKMDGYSNHGMVHLSQISDHEVTNRNDSDAAKVEAISSVVGEGEQVWVKVISVKTEDDGSIKVGCSLKYVSQGDGRDLDPENLQLENLQSKPAWHAPKKLELEAVYNVVCTRCGGHGHLKKECYSTGEKTYELLQDEDTDINGAGSSKAALGVVPKSSAPAVGPSAKPPSGPAGRGRAMVQPAWMKHGVGVGGDSEKVLLGHSSKAVADAPEKLTTMHEALAVLGKDKEEKRKRKRDEKRHRKHSRRGKKHGSSSKEGRREKPKKRHRSEDSPYHSSRSRKKRRA